MIKLITENFTEKRGTIMKNNSTHKNMQKFKQCRLVQNKVTKLKGFNMRKNLKQIIF